MVVPSPLPLGFSEGGLVRLGVVPLYFYSVGVTVVLLLFSPLFLEWLYPLHL